MIVIKICKIDIHGQQPWRKVNLVFRMLTRQFSGHQLKQERNIPSL